VAVTDAHTDGEVEPSPAGTGRRLLGWVGLAIVTTIGLVGYIVGANNAGRAATVEVLWGLTLPVSGLTVALYGVVLSATALIVLFGLVELASRFDSESP
jgi:ABC-type hemin transport system ATPase subunit